MSAAGENIGLLDSCPRQKVAAEGILDRNFWRSSPKKFVRKEVPDVSFESTLNSGKIGLDRRGHRKLTMKKVLALVIITAVIGIVSCKPRAIPGPDGPYDATVTPTPAIYYSIKVKNFNLNTSTCLILTGIGGVYLKFDTPEGYGGFGMAEMFIITGVLTMANAVINYLTSEFTVTNKRVVVKLGFIKRTSLEMNMEKIEGIIIHQSILGRILNYGHVEVRGTGGSSQPFKLIKKPMELKNKVQEIQGGIK